MFLLSFEFPFKQGFAIFTKRIMFLEFFFKAISLFKTEGLATFKWLRPKWFVFELVLCNILKLLTTILIYVYS